MDELNQNPDTRGESGIMENDKTTISRNKNSIKNLAADEYHALKSSFISSISHEIRTPLNAILGFSELSLLNGADLNEMNDYMKIIHESSLKLLEKMKDITYISSLDSGMVAYEPHTISLEGMMKDLYDSFHHHYPKKSLQGKDVQVELKNTKHVFFKSNAVILTDLLKRLMDNGLKFTNQGTVSLSAEITDKKNITFMVKDTGIGIPDEKLCIIFEPFISAQDNHNKIYNAPGLGLTIVKHLVKLLGGHLKIYSKVEQGTEVRVSIPYHKMAAC